MFASVDNLEMLMAEASATLYLVEILRQASELLHH